MQTLSNLDPNAIDIELVAALIKHIHLKMTDGAILCFLPGWEDISKLNDRFWEIF